MTPRLRAESEGVMVTLEGIRRFGSETLASCSGSPIQEEFSFGDSGRIDDHVKVTQQKSERQFLPSSNKTKMELLPGLSHEHHIISHEHHFIS